MLRPTRLLRLLCVTLVLGIVAATTGQVEAQDSQKINKNIKELRQQRQEVQRAEAEAAAMINVAQATTDSLVAALEKVQKNVDTQKAALDAAEAAVTEAELNLREVQTAVAEHETELARIHSELRHAVVDSYIKFQSPSETVDILGDNPWHNARAEALAKFAVGSRVDGIDALRSVGAELEQLKNAAEEVASEVQSRRAEMSAQLADLTEARNSEADLTSKAEERLDTLLYEGQLLKAHDSELAAKISRETRRLAAAIKQEQAARSNTSTRVPPNSNIKLVSVRGIVVASSIETQTKGLLTAMESEGFNLGGGGYRTNAAQIALRKAHCGTSDYAVWQMPASRCRPPTARPGRSDHERGLAIDFTYKGRIISNRNSAVFKALQRIAPKYGFVNLPSEPWHWSNTQ